jgi:hypothetical protein
MTQMSDDIPENHIFLLKDLKANTHLNNYLIFFYQTQSYYYNTLDPIFNRIKIKEYAFTSSDSLLISPQFLGRSVYYALANYSFVQISLNSPQ